MSQRFKDTLYVDDDDDDDDDVVRRHAIDVIQSNGFSVGQKKSESKNIKDRFNSLAGIVVRMMQDEIGKDDLDTLSSVASEFVVAVHRRRVRRRVTRRRERAVLFHVTSEETITR